MTIPETERSIEYDQIRTSTIPAPRVPTREYNYDRQKAILRLTDRCANLSSEGLDIVEYVTSDTQKKVWVIRIPKHLPKRPVYAHDKA